jgi:large repetitive protein
VTVTARAYTHTGLTNGTTYTYRVDAYDAVGNESQPSAEVSATSPDRTAPSAPTGLAATAGDRRVALDWANNTEADPAGYRVYRKNADGSWSLVTTVTASAYTHPGLTNGTTYTYRVTADDTSGNESVPSARSLRPPQIGPRPPHRPDRRQPQAT